MQTPFAAIPDYLVQLIDQLRARLRDPNFVARHRRFATDFTRQRTLTFPVVCLMLLQKTGKSVQRHLREFLAAWFAEPGTAAVTAGAWTQARAKFKHTAFVELNQAVLLPLVYAPEQAAQRRTWRGHRLLGVDGSALRLPATAELLRIFGARTVTNQGGATGTCYPEARMSVLYDLRNDLALDARLEPLVSTQVWKRPFFEAFLPLLLTQEGGEGWGQEACFLSDSPLPTRSSRGEGSCVDTDAWNPVPWAKWTWPCNK